MKITAVVITKNERNNIEKCLKSLLWCDEVLVIDDYSTDKTRSLALKLGTKVYTRALNNNFAAQRNYGLEKAKNNWVLFIDADEITSKELKKEISSSLKQNHSGYLIKRIDYWKGKKLTHGETGNTYILRLAKKNSGTWKRSVHEYWDIKGSVAKLNHPIIHYPHKSVSDFISGIEMYSTIHAQEIYSECKRSNMFQLIFRPIGKFMNNYIVRKGFLDGTPGLIVAIVMSYHTYLSWSKLWILQTK